MSAPRRTIGQFARLAICGLLLAAIFHAIFCNEAQRTLLELRLAQRIGIGIAWTAHDLFRAPGLFDGVPLVVDTRNLVAPLVAAGAKGPVRLVKA